jgi:hypothetical protein
LINNLYKQDADARAPITTLPLPDAIRSEIEFQAGPVVFHGEAFINTIPANKWGELTAKYKQYLLNASKECYRLDDRAVNTLSDTGLLVFARA